MVSLTPLWAVLGALGSLALIYLGVRTWYLSRPGLRSFFFFRPCRLLAKQTLVEAAPGRLPVRRFTFALPGGSGELGADLAVGEHVKVRAAGLLPLSRSYSPVAARPGEFDLIIKIYPPEKGGKASAHVSSHLDSLRVGDAAYVSGPYPPPFKHMVRDGGKRVGILAFGVGITEALTVAQSELRQAEQVVLLWALRDQSELHAPEELQALEAAGLKVHYYFSRERGQRLGPEELRACFPWNEGRAEEQRFLVVGTKKMARAAHGMLTEAGIAHKMLLKKKLGLRPAPRPQLPGGGAQSPDGKGENKASSV